jgi:hypothetical protein
MSESLKIALTALAGIIVFVLGQIIQKTFIEPIQEHRRLVGKIIHALIYYANVQSGLQQSETIGEASRTFRNLSSQVLENISLIPCYKVLAALKLIYPRDVMYRISLQLQRSGQDFTWSGNLTCQQTVLSLLKKEHLLQYSSTNAE